jgi:RNA polymerase sigma-70 factor (ECF subfamily)
MDLYERYGRALVRKAERILQSHADAQDLVQGLFVDLWQKGETPEFPYLCRAITNRSLTFLRDERNRARILDGNDAVLRGPVRTRCDERTLDMDLLVKLISSVDEQTLEIIVLRFFDDMTQEEISSMVGLSRKTVGKKLDAVHEIVARMSSDTLDPSGGTS